MREIWPWGSPAADTVSEEDRFRLVTLAAAFAGLLFMGVHIWQLFSLESIGSLVRERGGSVPPYLVTLVGLSELKLLPVAVVLIDIGVFMLMMRLARRYWIGLLFTPLIVYAVLAVVYGYGIGVLESGLGTRVG